MVKRGVRSCDVCDHIIPNGKKYAVGFVAHDKAAIFKTIMRNNPEMAPVFAVDSKGDMRLDICLDCKMNIGIPSEIVN